jgi:predicted phosphodiesterase
MKIGLISDIHAEFYRNKPNWLPPLPDNPDVLVLAGDIHVGQNLIPFVKRISDALPLAHVIFIAGNHEFYRQHRLATTKAYQDAFSCNARIHFLENDCVDIGGVRFIGATLWTGFSPLTTKYSPEELMSFAQDNVSDFSLISEDSADNDTAFTPNTSKLLFEESKTKIAYFLAESDPSKCVVITHFPPTKYLRHPKFTIDKITSYFTADCADVIDNYQPAYWFYGHNHWSSTTRRGNTILISNQLGYPNERWNIGDDFNPNLMIDI